MSSPEPAKEYLELARYIEGKVIRSWYDGARTMKTTETAAELQQFFQKKLSELNSLLRFL